MTNREISVGLRIKGDNREGLDAVSGVRKELSGLQADGEKIKLLDGDSLAAKELATELERLQQETKDLATASARVQILESAIASVDRYRDGITAAEAKVRTLQATLSEAYNSGADKPLLASLEKQLAAAERAARDANSAFQQGTANLVKLNLEAGKTGITTGNLAEKKAELDAVTKRLAGDVDSLKSSLASVENTERRTAASTAALNTAFDSLGIRSAKQIHADIQAVNSALLALAQRADISGAEFDRAFAAAQARIERLRAELRGAPADVEQLGKSADMLAGGMSRLAAAYGGMELAREFVKANVAMESMQRTLLQMTGSGDAAAAEIDYLRQVANRLGLEVQTAGQAYMGLLASAKGTAMEGQKTREVFEAVAGAMAKLGRSSADTEGALQAVSQMMGKGVVSMEEMRQQLAERLPGAMQATADAMGVSVAELNTMIESGQVLAEDLLPKLAEGLKKMYGDGGEAASGAVASWNRLKNAMYDTFVFIGSSGVWVALVTLLDQAGIAVRGLTGAFELLGKSYGITVGAIVSFDWKHPIESIKNWKEAIKEAGADIQKRLDQVKVASEKAGEAQVKTATAGQHLATSWNTVQLAYTKVTKAAEEDTKQAIKSAEAREAEGKAAKELVATFGTEGEKRAANQAAARADAVALAAVAAARDREAKIAQSQVAALQAAADAEGKVSDAKMKAIQAATDAATAKQTEAEKAAAAALQAREHAAALEVENAALLDNSSRVVELKAAYEEKAKALEAARAADNDSVESTARVREAEIEAGKAAYLYRDALHDVTQGIQARASAARASNSLDQANVTLALEHVRTTMAVARAKGDEGGFIRAKNEASRLEIELSRLKADALRKEAEFQLKLVESMRAYLESKGQLTAVRKAELDAQEAGAKIKKVEADIADELARRTRDLTDATRQSGNAARDMGDGFTGAAGELDRMAGAADRTTQALQRLNNQRRPGGSAGWGGGGSGPDGELTVEQMRSLGWSATQIQDYLSDRRTSPEEKAAGIVKRPVFTANIDYARAAAQHGLEGEAAQRFIKIVDVRMNAELQALQNKLASFGVISAETYREFYSGAMQRAIDQSVEMARAIPDSQARKAQDAPIPTGQPQSGQGSYNVTVSIGGRKSKIATASAQDADALAELLRRLEDERSRASIV